jgi:hypothetical protein
LYRKKEKKKVKWLPKKDKSLEFICLPVNQYINGNYSTSFYFLVCQIVFLIFFLLFCFSLVQEFELRDSYLLGGCSITWTVHPTLICQIVNTMNGAHHNCYCIADSFVQVSFFHLHMCVDIISTIFFLLYSFLISSPLPLVPTPLPPVRKELFWLPVFYFWKNLTFLFV